MKRAIEEVTAHESVQLVGSQSSSNGLGIEMEKMNNFCNNTVKAILKVSNMI